MRRQQRRCKTDQESAVKEVCAKTEFLEKMKKWQYNDPTPFVVSPSEHGDLVAPYSAFFFWC